MHTLRKEYGDPFYLDINKEHLYLMDYALVCSKAIYYKDYESAIVRANFKECEELLEGHDYEILDLQGSRHLLINPECKDALKIVQDIWESLENYPILNEDRLSFCEHCNEDFEIEESLYTPFCSRFCEDKDEKRRLNELLDQIQERIREDYLDSDINESKLYGLLYDLRYNLDHDVSSLLTKAQKEDIQSMIEDFKARH